MISREFESKSFYHANPVITEVIQYQFEACEHDKVSQWAIEKCIVKLKMRLLSFRFL